MTLCFRTLLCLIFCYGMAQAAHPKLYENAQKIDQLVEKRLSELNLQPNSIANDSHFLRRSSLGIIGRVPTVEEADRFLHNPESGKKERLIDQLLDHPGYASHQTNWMSDIIRARSRGNNPVFDSGQVFIDWIKECFSDNKPYDEFVYEMLASSGDLWEKGNAPVGYYMRDYRMPQDNLSNTMQVFLGTRMQCAQCHDHPFDKWTQKNFYEINAFINGIDYQNRETNRTIREATKMAGVSGKERANRDIQRTLNFAMTPGLYGPGNGHTRLPWDYQYKDHKPGEIILAKTPFGPDINLDYHEVNSKRKYSEEKVLQQLKKGKGRFQPIYKDNDSRTKFAEWVTSPENPRFAKVIANRLWKRVMGMGLIEPVDDIRERTMASDPELMSFLENMMVEYEFNLKEFYRTLYYTKTFSRNSQKEDVAYTTEMGFPGPLMKRLSAEQIWDSLMALRSDKVDENLIKPTEGRYPVYYALQGKSAEEIAKEIEKSKTQTDKKGKVNLSKYLGQKNMGSMSSMSMMAQKTQNPKQMAKEYKAKLEKEIGPKPKDKTELKAWYAKHEAAKKEYSTMVAKYKVDLDPNYFRASEMRMPARPGHFLYQLGQSTKQSIEGSTDEANIPQVLTLMNGLEPLIYGNEFSGIRKDLESKATPEEKIDTIFKGTLTRKATPEERQDMLAFVEDSPKTAYQDILWVLVNTHEFKFIQ